MSASSFSVDGAGGDMVTFRGAFSLLRDPESSPPMEGKRVEAAAAVVCVRRCGLLSVDDDDGGLGLGGVPRGRPADGVRGVRGVLGAGRRRRGVGELVRGCVALLSPRGGGAIVYTDRAAVAQACGDSTSTFLAIDSQLTLGSNKTMPNLTSNSRSLSLLVTSKTFPDS